MRPECINWLGDRQAKGRMAKGMWQHKYRIMERGTRDEIWKSKKNDSDSMNLVEVRLIVGLSGYQSGG